MKVRILVIALLLVTGLVGLFVFAFSFAWSMADFDCVAGYWECSKDIIVPAALFLGLPIAAWSVLAGLLVRELKKA